MEISMRQSRIEVKYPGDIEVAIPYASRQQKEIGYLPENSKNYPMFV